ncbi:Cinnamoyl-CoA reductase 1 [Dendrobium catenatum]|uniref:Cinnamoyl-CoA reductase 1 n=1 Tax=Dendrobium catenatum TaxID=906689 RepID=A0A2I0W4C4_9ASPA|nr:Cinnamoyl-CoA reductase 1 [Dendrobium catenatum]
MCKPPLVEGDLYCHSEYIGFGSFPTDLPSSHPNPYEIQQLERKRELKMEEQMSELRRVCVTGAGGFIGSWLVKLLLSEGYKVHGTVRDPSNEKNAHLKKLDRATKNLQLFKADLLDYNAIVEAISGCEGVFHVASPVILSGASNPEEEIISPALLGTKNVLKACSETSVKRVVVVSSAAAIMFNPDWAQGTIMDESCWSNEEFCRSTETGISNRQYTILRYLLSQFSLSKTKKKSPFLGFLLAWVHFSFGEGGVAVLPDGIVRETLAGLLRIRSRSIAIRTG